MPHQLIGRAPCESLEQRCCTSAETRCESSYSCEVCLSRAAFQLPFAISFLCQVDLGTISSSWQTQTQTSLYDCIYPQRKIQQLETKCSKAKQICNLFGNKLIKRMSFVNCHPSPQVPMSCLHVYALSLGPGFVDKSLPSLQVQSMHRLLFI